MTQTTSGLSIRRASERGRTDWGWLDSRHTFSGVTHSEFNHSKTEPVHFLQIWIVPDARNLEPAYAQRAFDRDAAGRRRSLPVGKLW